jgi:hypothetical protein
VRRTHCRHRWSAWSAGCGTLLMMAVAAMAEMPVGFAPEVIKELNEAKQIYVATARKDGTRSTAVPVWFGYVDDAIWFTTSPGSHKGRRVRGGSPVFVSVRGKDGPFLKTKAEIVKDPAQAERLGAFYSKKYWIAWLGFFRPSGRRVQSGKVLLLRLTPAPDSR